MISSQQSCIEVDANRGLSFTWTLLTTTKDVSSVETEATTPFATSKQFLEETAETAASRKLTEVESSRATLTKGFRVFPSFAILIVLGTLLRITNHLVGFGKRLNFAFAFGSSGCKSG